MFPFCCVVGLFCSVFCIFGTKGTRKEKILQIIIFFACATGLLLSAYFNSIHPERINARLKRQIELQKIKKENEALRNELKGMNQCQKSD